MQPLGNRVFAAGAGYCWQHFSQQCNLIDCPNLYEFPSDADVLKVQPSGQAWATIKDRFPLIPIDDEEE